MTMQTEGRVEYGARAFEQDASLAIRGDIVRALIELVTNGDDAYGSSEGEIWIRVAPTDEPGFVARIEVQDTAKGLSADGLRKAFAVLGGQRDEDDGALEARGLLGRGAKDVASLGRVEFVAIKDGKYSRLELKASGDWKLTDVDVEATDEHRQELALDAGQNGLTATLWVADKFRVPSRNKLHDKLTRTAQLRDLVGRRPVYLADFRDTPTTLRLDPPPVLGEVVIDTELQVNGYDPVRLIVRRLPKRATGSVNEFSEHGLLVRSGVTVFQNTWFDLDNRPEAAYFTGELVAPQIAPIIRAYDDGDPIGGPLRLLSRDRDGLVKTHPYRKELARAVTREVLPLFEALSKQMDAGKKQGEKLTKAFKVAGEALKEQVRAALEEIEDDEELSGGNEDQTPALAVIPPRRVLTPGETATLTIRAAAQPPTSCTAVIEQQSGDDVIASIAVSEDGWMAHPRLQAVQTHIYIDAGLKLGSATIRVDAAGHSARAEIVVATPSSTEPDAPEGLMFTTPRASISPQRRRKLELRAPIEWAGEEVIIGMTGSGLASVPPAVILVTEPNGRWARALVACQASSEAGVSLVTASRADDSATCEVSVAEAAGRGGLGMEFDLNGHKSPVRRVELSNDNGQITVRVYALHPTFNGVFGAYDEAESKFANEDSPQARAILAEVVAAELAAHLTERDYNQRPEQLNDAPRVLYRRADFANRFVGILHRSLAPSS